MAADWSSVLGAASPLNEAGVDPDEALASGDPAGMVAAKKAGVPYQAKPGVTRTTLGSTSALPTPALDTRNYTPGSRPALDTRGAIPGAAPRLTPAAYATGVSRPPNGGAVTSTSPQPADNAPNPPSEPTGAPAVPSTVSPGGGSRFSQMAQDSLASKKQVLDAAAQNPAVQRMQQLEQQKTGLLSPASSTNPTGLPNAGDQQYKPSVGRRIARGFEGVGLGLAEGGLRGAIAGGIAPQTTGLAGYNDPNSAFYRAQQANKEASTNVGQQLTAEQEQEKLRTEGQKTANETAAQYGTLADQADKAGGKGDTPTLDQQYSAAVKDALDKGVDPSTDKTVQQLADAKTSLSRQAPPKEPGREDKAVAIYAKDPSQRTPDENAFIRGYEHDVKITKTDPGVARTSVLLQMPQAVADPTVPGGVKYTTRAGSIGQQAPSSSTVRVPAKVLEDFTSGTDARTVTRFNTAVTHLDRLAQVSNALKNGDTRVFNDLGNKWATESGHPAPTNFDAVKAAVAGEVAGTFKGSGATDEEIEQITKTIQSKNSPSELGGVINEYRSLIGSKRDALKTQFDQGVKGKPGFGNGDNAPPSSGKEVSLAAAKALPQNKNTSDDDIRKDIVAHGHRVKE